MAYKVSPGCTMRTQGVGGGIGVCVGGAGVTVTNTPVGRGVLVASSSIAGKLVAVTGGMMTDKVSVRVELGGEMISFSSAGANTKAAPAHNKRNVNAARTGPALAFLCWSSPSNKSLSPNWLLYGSNVRWGARSSADEVRSTLSSVAPQVGQTFALWCAALPQIGQIL